MVVVTSTAGTYHKADVGISWEICSRPLEDASQVRSQYELETDSLHPGNDAAVSNLDIDWYRLRFGHIFESQCCISSKFREIGIFFMFQLFFKSVGHRRDQRASNPLAPLSSSNNGHGTIEKKSTASDQQSLQSSIISSIYIALFLV